MEAVPDQPATTDDDQPLEHLQPVPGGPANVVWDSLKGERRYMTVVECIGRIIEELPAIGKNQRNQSQNFNFRGIDDVQNALTPLLGKYGVFYVPDVLERVPERRTTSGGSTMYEVDLHVRYTFYGPGGDSISGSGWGEGTDMGDKATSKAMTMAMKYVLFQVFAIATAEQSEHDADRTTPEETRAGVVAETAVVLATEQQLITVLNRIKAVVEAAGGEYPQSWRDAIAQPNKPGTYKIETLEAMLIGDRPKTTEASVTVMLEVLDALDPAATPDAPAADGENAPCSLCGSTRAQRVTVDGVWRCSNPKDCAKRAEARAAESSSSPDTAAQNGQNDDSADDTDGENQSIDCTDCGEPITEDQALVWSDDEKPYHAEHAPFLGGGATG